MYKYIFLYLCIRILILIFYPSDSIFYYSIAKYFIVADKAAYTYVSMQLIWYYVNWRKTHVDDRDKEI